VDYSARRAALESVKKLSRCIELDALAAHPLAKLIVTHRVLEYRREHPQVFAGEYRPVEAPEGMIVFERAFGSERVVIVAPRLTPVAFDLAGEWRCAITGLQVSGSADVSFGLFVEN
jgi:maltooligosyltrehalose synthase